MSNKKVFCCECRKDVEYSVIDTNKNILIKEKEYTVKYKQAICNKCNNEVYVKEIEEYNLDNFNYQYRKENDLISIREILEIPHKYNIGKRPLSILLNWGEMTFTRYCNGDMPTKQYSDILKKIYNEPIYYLEILNNNKDKLKSELTYNKSKKAVEEILGSNKIDLITNYLICKCEDITPLSLQKALYYIQGFYYSFTHNYLFKEDCQAWVHGPVYREIYDKYKEYKYEKINQYKYINEENFDDFEKEIIDNVIKYFCCYSGKILEQFTHLEQPWKIARKGLATDKNSEKIIDKCLINKYFEIVKKEYNISKPEDIKNYSKKMFDMVV